MHVRCRLFQVLSLLTLKFAPAVVACTLPQSQFIIRHLPGTPARFTKRFATRESSGPSLAARTALQPWEYFCFFVQWVCSRALSLCSGLASLLLWPQWPPLLWLCSCLAPCTPFHCRLALVLLARSTALASLRCPWLLPFAGQQPLSAQFWSRTRSRACCRLLQIIDSVYRSLLRLVGGPSE